MPQILITLSNERARWNGYVSRHPRSTQYHQYEWLTVIHQTFGHRVFPLLATSEDHVVGILPLVLVRSWLFGGFLVSLPYVNYGGLLADDETVERALWNHAVDVARTTGVRLLEARHLSSRAFIDERRQHKATMILDLAGSEDAQWREFNSKLRNQIRKAERSGLTARSADATDVCHFYKVFAHNMRDLGTPVHSQGFFAEILAAFPESSRIVLVERQGTVVAAGIALRYRDTLEVPWAASLKEYRTMCPNNLLYWELIRQAIGERLKHFDFGRSTPGDGPYKFKEQWGAKPIPLAWEYWLPEARSLPDLSPKNRKYSAAIGIWKRLPLTLTKWIGPAIVRGIPS